MTKKITHLTFFGAKKTKSAKNILKMSFHVQPTKKIVNSNSISIGVIFKKPKNSRRLTKHEKKICFFSSKS